MQLDGRKDGAVRARHRPQETREVAGDRSDHVRHDHPARGEPRACQLEKLDRREMEWDRVGVEGVDHDHVPAAVVAGEPAAAVLGGDAQALVAGERKPAIGDVDDILVQLDHLQLERGKVTPEAFRRRAAAEPDEQDPPRVGVVRQPEVEVVRVAKARPEGLADVHPALERAVETEVARVVVVGDDQPVVARVFGEADGEAVGLDGARIEH